MISNNMNFKLVGIFLVCFVVTVAALWFIDPKFIPAQVASSILDAEMNVSLKSMYKKEFPMFNQNAIVTYNWKSYAVLLGVVIGIPLLLSRVIWRAMSTKNG